MGLFVVIEGVEGSGKTTQCRILKRRLAREDYNVALVREPGGTPTGERIRRWLKSGNELTPLSELFLLMASRAALVESGVRPALERNEVVVCDRYIYSTIAYQGHGRGLDMNLIEQLNQTATGGLVPHLAVLLDIAPKDGLNRKRRQTLDRYEQEQIEFHERVRQGYLNIARREQGRWLTLDASRPRTEISDAIWERVSNLL